MCEISLRVCLRVPQDLLGSLGIFGFLKVPQGSLGIFEFFRAPLCSFGSIEIFWFFMVSLGIFGFLKVAQGSLQFCRFLVFIEILGFLSIPLGSFGFLDIPRNFWVPQGFLGFLVFFRILQFSSWFPLIPSSSFGLLFCLVP